MAVYIVTKGSSFGVGDEIIGVFDNKDKADNVVKQHMSQQDGWYQNGDNEWHNIGYEWHMKIQEHEVK
jgi:hypothetical protein